MLEQRVACETISPHLYMTSYTQVTHHSGISLVEFVTSRSLWLKALKTWQSQQTSVFANIDILAAVQVDLSSKTTTTTKILCVPGLGQLVQASGQVSRCEQLVEQQLTDSLAVSEFITQVSKEHLEKKDMNSFSQCTENNH